jgi:Ca-activated chloride channel family protein
MMPVQIDEDMLRTVAQQTGGRYFRATSKEGLRTVYEEIDQLEKTEIEERVYTDRDERYPLFLWPAFGLLCIEVLLSTTVLRRFP